MFRVVPFNGVDSLTCVDFGLFEEGDVVLLVSPVDTTAQTADGEEEGV